MFILRWRTFMLMAMTATWLMLMAGCNSVVSTHPVGQPAALEAFDSLTGVWKGGEIPSELMYIKYMGEGRLKIAGMRWSEDHFEMDQFNATLTTLGETVYVNVIPPEAKEEDEQAYSFVQLTITEDGSLVGYSPNYEVFEQAVKQGELAGNIQEHDYSKTIHITADKADLDAFIQPNRMHEQFNLAEPVVLHRIADFE